MAHYAILNSQNKVINVIVGADEHTQDDDTIGSADRTAQWENEFAVLLGADSCKRTSYNTRGNEHINGGTPYRKNYASIGYSYDAEKDAFIPPKPFDSWTLNETTCLWESPVAYPDVVEDDDGNPIIYTWNETNQSWDNG